MHLTTCTARLVYVLDWGAWAIENLGIFSPGGLPFRANNRFKYSGEGPSWYIPTWNPPQAHAYQGKNRSFRTWKAVVWRVSVQESLQVKHPLDHVQIEREVASSKVSRASYHSGLRDPWDIPTIISGVTGTEDVPALDDMDIWTIQRVIDSSEELRRIQWL